MKFGYLLLFISCFLVGCSSEEIDDISQNEPANKLVQTSTLSTMYGGDVNSTYLYNGTKLNQIIDDLGNSQTFHYNGDLIESIDLVDEFGNTSRYEYAYDNQGRVISSKDISGPWGRKQVYEYQSDGSVLVSLYFGSDTVQDQLVSTAVMELENGEIKRTISTEVSNFEQTTNEYSYDSKNSPMKNITGYSKILGLFNYNQKGILQNTSSQVQTRNGEVSEITKNIRYDADNYPVEINSSDPLDGETFTIRYKY